MAASNPTSTPENIYCGRTIVGIMAATEEGVVGKDNRLPWSYPDEYAHFTSIVSGNIIIMGRKTYEDTPLLCEEKHTIVLSRNRDLVLRHAKVVNSIHECIKYVESLNPEEKVFMIGGPVIAHAFLERNLISSFILTIVREPYQGDTRLDLSYFDGWSKRVLSSCADYTIFELTKCNKGASCVDANIDKAPFLESAGSLRSY